MLHSVEKWRIEIAETDRAMSDIEKCEKEKGLIFRLTHDSIRIFSSKLYAEKLMKNWLIW